VKKENIKVQLPNLTERVFFPCEFLSSVSLLQLYLSCLSYLNHFCSILFKFHLLNQLRIPLSNEYFLPTTHPANMRSVAAFVLAAAAPAVMAETHIITALSSLVFDPELTTAVKGDIIEFQFQGQNHSVIMGDLKSDSCAPAAGGFNSGFMPVSGELGVRAWSNEYLLLSWETR
jgi:plastocyanin